MIEIIDTIEHEDGSATLTIEMDQETLKKFAEKGIIDTIKEYVANQKIEISAEVDWGKPVGKELW